MIAFIITVVTTAGIIGFYQDFYITMYIGAILTTIELFIGYYSGQLKSLWLSVFSCFIGMIATNNILNGIAIGLCFENTISYILGIIFDFFILFFTNKENKLQNETLKKANYLATLRGFNNWIEFKNAFYLTNNTLAQLNSSNDFEEINYIIMQAGFNNIDEAIEASKIETNINNEEAIIEKNNTIKKAEDDGLIPR